MASDPSLDVRNINPLLKNYDYGDGFYSNMEKYKSVSDFKKRKKKMKKRKKLLAFLISQ